MKLWQDLERLFRNCLILAGFFVFVLFWWTACTDPDPFYGYQTPEQTHNAAGGYIDACGDLPGMVGDDC
jgi:hypothetical protein